MAADNSTPPRRSFFQWLTYGLGAVAAAVVGVPFVGYLLPKKRATPPWVNLGELAKFPLGETLLVSFDNPISKPWDGIVAQTAVHVRNEGKDEKGNAKFLVLAINCAHLGCPVTWFQQSGLFMCPCHGGVYYANGDHASGPPPRGLFHCVWQVVDGKLQIQAPHYPTLQDTLSKKDV